MGRPYLISQYMDAELPGISVQKRMPFRPSVRDVQALYKSINRHMFDNCLTLPEIQTGVLQKCWGRCIWEPTQQRRGSHGKTGTWCSIQLYDKWFSPQWFCTTLAHEMVHQYQWDVYRFQFQDQHGRKMFEYSGAHGPSFYAWRECFESWGVPLKISHGQKRWFKHQDLFKC